MAEGKLDDLNLGQVNRSWGRPCLYPDRGEGSLVLPRSPWHRELEYVSNIDGGNRAARAPYPIYDGTSNHDLDSIVHVTEIFL